MTVHMPQSEPAIYARLEVAFERARWRYPESPPKWIYLDPSDWREFDAAVRKKWPSAVHCFSYRDVQIRSGKRSRIVTKCGSLVAVPKHLSPMTRKAA